MKYRKKNQQLVPLQYPKYGMRGWLKDCRKHLQSLKVDILIDTKIKKLVKNKKEFYVLDDKGNRYNAGKLCYSNMFHLEELEINGENVPTSYEQDASQHLVFIVKGVPPNKALPFWRIMKDSYFMFLNDISKYSPEFQDKYPGHRLINARVYAYKQFTKAEIKTYFSHISYLGYFDKDVKMVDYHYTYINRSVMTYAWGYRFKKLLGNKAYELRSGSVGLHNGLRGRYEKYIK